MPACVRCAVSLDLVLSGKKGRLPKSESPVESDAARATIVADQSEEGGE